MNENETRPYEADIPRELAQAAHAGTSMTPETRAAQERSGYAATMQADHEMLAGHAPTPEKQATLAEEFARYRTAYADKTRRYLASRSRIVSSFIAGPSNFPARRMEKRNEIADRRLRELVEFRERALAAIKRALHPEWRPIMAGDDNATERLRVKIVKAECLQQAMKAANAAIRKHAKAGAEAQVAAVVALGFTEEQARRLLEPDYCGRIGFADYETRNNGANIRRMKERLEAVTRTQAMPDTAKEGTAARVEDCPAENRVRLYFPAKPAREIIEELKSNGWRWTPSLGCWQAYRNTASLALADKLKDGGALEIK